MVIKLTLDEKLEQLRVKREELMTRPIIGADSDECLALVRSLGEEINEVDADIAYLKRWGRR